MGCYENVSKYKHWDIRSALGQSAKQALLSKPCFPLTKPEGVWFGIDVTVYAISPSRKPKCTCPTLTQQSRTTGMWSDEEGSRTSSGHWFPFMAFLLLGKQSTSWQLLSMSCSLQTGQHSRFGGTPSVLTPKCTCGYGTNSPDTRDLFVSSGMLMHVNHILLPSFWVTPSLPQTHCPPAFPLHPAPTRLTSQEAFLNPFS